MPPPLNRPLLFLIFERNGTQFIGQQLIGVRFLFVPHSVIFPAESVTTKGALKFSISSVNHVVPLEVF